MPPPINLGLARDVTLFGRTKALESQIDEFLGKLSESG